MSDQHQHVDLDVLQEVERLLTRVPTSTAPRTGTPGLAATRGFEYDDDARDDAPDTLTDHPSAHQPEGSLVSEYPHPPLPRRR